MDKRTTLLLRQPLFEQLPDEALHEVLSLAHIRHVKRGEYLFYEEDPADTFYIVQEGRIRLSKLSPEGQQVVVRFITPGEAFGIVAVFANIPYPVTADAVEDSILIGWYGDVFEQLMERYPRLALNGMQIMASYMHETLARLRELTTERVERRLANALLRLARQIGKRTPEGILLDLPLTRKDLAELTGTTLYTVSRILSKWQEEEIVRTSREQICICEPHRLMEIAM